MSTFDESLHPRGQTGNAGQFREKSNTAPTAGLEGLDLPAFSAGDVRTLAFTLESLRTIISADVHDTDPDEDGHTRVMWVDEYQDSTTGHRATIDEQGELLRLEERWNDGPWHDADHDGRQLHAHRHRINRDRLAFAGILTHGTDNDGGAYGRRFTGGHAHERIYDGAEIARRIRGDLKRAQEVGAIPADLTYRVTTQKYAGGQSITVHAEGVTDDKHYVDTPSGHRGRHPWSNELDSTLSVIGEQWQDSETDSMTDYFNVLYYFRVDIPDERSQAWHREQRELAAAKRAAAKARRAS